MDCLFGFGTSLAGKLSEYTVQPIGSQFGELGYLLYYKSHIDNLKNQDKQLGFAKERLQHSIDVAQRNCEEIEAGVNNWLSQADKMSGDAENFLRGEDQANKKCLCSCFPNWFSRYKFSKKAAKMAQEIAELIGSIRFDNVSYRVSPHGIIEIKGFLDFQSRKPNLEVIMEALRDSSVGMIGVYGVAGIGKTMLVKEVARRAVEEKVFSDAIMATVSQNPNSEILQQEVAEKVGLEFHEKTVSIRSNRLKCRLRREEKILIILDDLWEKLELDDAGISFGDDQKGCKILLTSRSQDVLCDYMGTEKNFQIETLSDSEATYLFNTIVGDSAEKPEFETLATQIVEKCRGLPGTIAKVGYELKNKSLFIWKDTLTQLQRSTTATI